MSAPWRLEEPPLDSPVGAPPSLLVSLAFLRAALRRRRRTWATLGCAGLLLAVAYAVLVPPPSKATVTVALAHPPGSNAADEMLTDLSLLQTRAVAQQTIDALGSSMTADELERSVVAEIPTNTVLKLTVSAPDASTALTTASTLVDTYLAFRAEQLREQATAQTSGDRKRIVVLRQQVDTLTKEFDANSRGTPAQQAAAQIALTRSSRLNDQVDALQQSIDTAMNGAESLIDASTVIDKPALVQVSTKRRLVLVAASGLIGGIGLGCGLVLFAALTTSRLRRREEVALAIGAPVQAAVERLRPRRLAALGLPSRRRRSVAATEGLEVLAHSLESAFDRVGRSPARLVLATVDNEPEGTQIAGAVGVRLTGGRRGVFLVDLSTAGRLEKTVQDALGTQRGPSMAPAVFRPRGVPALARGPLAPVGSTSELRDDDPLRAGWDAADLVLTLASVDLNTGSDELASWGEHVVLLVTAGRSSAERLRGAADLLRRAGLRVLCVLMIGADPTDESIGRTESEEAADEQGRRQVLS